MGKIKLKNFRGAIPLINLEPTEKELLWLFNKLNEIDWDKHWAASVDESCHLCDPWDELDDAHFVIYHVPLEIESDADPDCWETEHRGLAVIYCTRCECWEVGEYYY